MDETRKTVAVTITVPKALMERVDAYRDATGVSRSAIIQGAIQDYLAQKEMIQKAVARFAQQLPQLMPEMMSSASEGMRGMDVPALMLESLKKADLSGIEGTGDVDGK